MNEVKVLGMGNALTDILVRLPNDNLLGELNIPRGSMQLVDADLSAKIYEHVKNLNPQSATGGSACNTIRGLANLGVETGILGKVGRNDEVGQFFLHEMEEKGVHSHILYSESLSGNCISMISPDSERTMATCLGAAAELSAEEISEDIFEGYTHFYVEGYLVQNYELIEKAFQIAKSKGMTTCLDLASYNVVEANTDFLNKLIKNYVDVVFANEEEATAFTGKEDTEALNDIGDLCDVAVVKQGCRGSLIKWNEETVRVGIIKASSIDTTGAGDMYAAGFLYGMFRGMNARQCGEMGAILSGNVIEVVGTNMDTIRWNRIRQALSQVK